MVMGDSVEIGGLAQGNKISWSTDDSATMAIEALHDQGVVEGTGGKFDIGFFGFDEGLPTPDQNLAFAARITDGDGDTDEDMWFVGIDGTGEPADGGFDNDSTLPWPSWDIDQIIG